MTNVKDSYNKFIKTPMKHKDVRIYNNEVKKYSINKVYKDNKKPFNNILDLCGGKGGDILKLSFVSEKDKTTLVVMDFSEERNKAYGKRLENLDFTFKKYIILNVDLLQDNLDNLTDIKFDLINFQFAIHYFFKSKTYLERIINLLTNCCEKNGYVLISTTDENKLIKSKLDNVTIKNTDGIYNREVLFKMEGSVDALEYLPDHDTLINSFKNNFDIIYDKNFSDIFPDRKTPELSKLYRMYILKKK